MCDSKLDVYTVHSYKNLTRVRPLIPSKLIDSFHKAGVFTCKVKLTIAVGTLCSFL